MQKQKDLGTRQGLFAYRCNAKENRKAKLPYVILSGEKLLRFFVVEVLLSE